MTKNSNSCYGDSVIKKVTIKYFPETLFQFQLWLREVSIQRYYPFIQHFVVDFSSMTFSSDFFNSYEINTHRHALHSLSMCCMNII